MDLTDLLFLITVLRDLAPMCLYDCAERDNAWERRNYGTVIVCLPVIFDWMRRRFFDVMGRFANSGEIHSNGANHPVDYTTCLSELRATGRPVAAFRR